ncbi:TPA: GntR family transcriptional regulator [Citrobacter freundii]|nr:GntR family transcriptional regulator [Citrobacter freundii]EKV4364555.1 GntR family transcriptional regulator [Citrobacter freundii]HCH7903932.1 GntR family transcriptional regulator [Klebsiella oxytoca]HDT6516838.1 GntR family transcriptional regulator [Citrobacter freundii]
MKRDKESVYTEIKSKILNFSLKPGDNLNANALSKEYGLSNMPIRDVFIRLSYDKLVDIYPQSGTFVSKIDLAYVNETAFMRYILEKSMFSVLSTTEEILDFSDLDRNISDQRKALEKKDFDHFLFFDNQFHSLIFSLANHHQTWDLIQNIKFNYNRMRFLNMSDKNALEKIFTEHLVLLDSLKNKEFDKINDILFEHLIFSEEEINISLKSFPEYFTSHSI